MEEKSVEAQKPFYYEKECRLPGPDDFDMPVCAIPITEAKKIGIGGFYGKIFCRTIDGKEKADIGSIMNFILFICPIVHPDNKNRTIVVCTNHQEFISFIDVVVEKMQTFKKKTVDEVKT